MDFENDSWGGYEWWRDEPHFGAGDIKSSSEITLRTALFLRDRSNIPPGAAFSGPADTCADPELGNPPPAAHSQGLAVTAGGVQDRIVQLDSNGSVHLTVFVERADAQFDLRSAAGTSLIPPGAYIAVADDGVIYDFSVQNPPLGAVTLRLTAGASDASASVLMGFANGRGLGITVPTSVLSPTDPALIVAGLFASDGTPIVGDGGTVDVTITLPDRSVQTLALFDDGAHGDGAAADGVFGASFTGTTQGGRYYVLAQAALNLGPEVVQRTASGMFVVNSTPGTLAGVSREQMIDSTGDSRYDRLEIDTALTFAEPGAYTVTATLRDASGVEIAEAQTGFNIAAGTSSHTATLVFDAGEIVAHGVDGPWTLAGIQLVDDAQALTVDTLGDYVTGVYGLSALSLPRPPEVLDLNPAGGPLAGGNQVTLQGRHLQHVTAVRFGVQAATGLQVLGDGTLRVTMPLRRRPG